MWADVPLWTSPLNERYVCNVLTDGVMAAIAIGPQQPTCSGRVHSGLVFIFIYDPSSSVSRFFPEFKYIYLFLHWKMLLRIVWRLTQAIFVVYMEWGGLTIGSACHLFLWTSWVNSDMLILILLTNVLYCKLLWIKASVHNTPQTRVNPYLLGPKWFCSRKIKNGLN